MKSCCLCFLHTRDALTSIGSLSSDVFERRTSTRSEPFSLLVSLYATVFVLPSVLILIETICSKICSKSRLKCVKSPFPVHVRRSKTSLLKLPIVTTVNHGLFVTVFLRGWKCFRDSASRTTTYCSDQWTLDGQSSVRVSKSTCWGWPLVLCYLQVCKILAKLFFSNVREIILYWAYFFDVFLINTIC